jgi:hypothetical protein
MSKTRRDAIHQAGLLQNEILRLDERRRRQIARAEGAFQLDLHALVDGRAPWLLDMVQTAVEHSAQLPGLAASLRTARGMGDAPERALEPPGMPTRVPRFEPDLPLVGPAPRPEPRYPEPGEAARVLDDGSVVADEGSPW